MSAEPEKARPGAVSVIGWIWVVFGGYLLLRGLLDLVLWSALGPLRPMLLAALRGQAPEGETVSLLLKYGRVVYVAKAVFGAFAFVSAWQLLRLRSPARVAMQVVGWLLLAYSLSFAAFWSWLWPRVAAAKANDPVFTSRSYASAGLIAGLAVCALMAAAVATQILVLRSAHVRAAFEAALETPPPRQPSRE